MSAIADAAKELGITSKWAQDAIDAEEAFPKVKTSTKLSSLRGKGRARQVTTKFNKVGTLVMGCMANGDPYIPLIIVRSAKLAKEHTFSWIEGPDGEPEKVELPKLRTAGKNRDAFVAATANGGMNKELFLKYLNVCVFPCHPLMSPEEQCVFWWDGDESHLIGSDMRALRDRGAVVVPPKPNTTTDCQGQDLVSFPVVQQHVRAQCANRQRMIRRMGPKYQRPLDARDMVAIVAPAIERGFTRANNMAAWSEAGLSPFSEAPKFQPHIQATKSRKVVKKNTLNYEALDYNKPIHPQFQEQIGKGNRLTVGKICGVPLTHEDNLKLFDALDREKLIESDGRAAEKRIKSGNPKPGDDEKAKAWEELKLESAKVKIPGAMQRQADGAATKADLKLLKSRLARRAMEEAGAAPPLATANRPRASNRRRKKSKSADDADSDESDDGADLVGKSWEDEELGPCTVTGRCTVDGCRALEYSYEEDGSTEETYSSVAEVREWIEES